LDYKEIDTREFSNWSREYMPDSSLTTLINLKFSGNNKFIPYDMLGESAHQMMLELEALSCAVR
jgi:hypothetical protein